MQIAYFTNIAITRDSCTLICDADYKALKQLLAGGKSGAHFKKIKGSTQSGCAIYSSRLSREGRLLYMIMTLQGKQTVVILDKFDSHKDYTQKLQAKGLLSHYLKHLDPTEIQTLFTEDTEKTGIPPDSKLTLEEQTLFEHAFTTVPQAIHYTLEGKIVAFNSKQQEVDFSTRIIQGNPGTGKTAVLISLFEEAYTAANRIAAEPETKHSSEAIQQFLYLTTTSHLAEKVAGHLETVIPNKILPCMSKSYQDFAAMLDPTIPPVTPIKGMTYKTLKHEQDFIDWCAVKNLKLEDYLESPKENKTNFYKKLYQEFRIISGCETIEDYQKLGLQDSLFQKNNILRASLFKLFQNYKNNTQDGIDLNFYDLRDAIKIYQAANPHVNPQLFVDETQNLSRLELLNVLCYIKQLTKITLCSDPRQGVFDAIPNVEFLKSYFFNKGIAIKPILLEQSYRVPKAVAKVLNQLSKLENQYNRGIIGSQVSAIIDDTEIKEEGEVTHLTLTKEVVEKYKELCNRPNYAIVVGDASLIPAVETKLGATLIFTPEQIIGLEFEHLIGYEIWKAFSQEALEALIVCCESITDEQFLHKPKDKEDKSKHPLLPLLHQLYVEFSRPKRTLTLLAEDKTTAQNSSKNHKRRAKQKQLPESPEKTLTQYLLATQITPEKRMPLPVTQEPEITPEIIHQEWVETCQTLIIKSKAYTQALASCIKHSVTPSELNLSEDLRAHIPQEYHKKFFLPKPAETACVPKPATTQKQTLKQDKHNLSKKPQSIEEQKMSKEESYVRGLYKNFKKIQICRLFEEPSKKIYTLLFKTTVIANQNLWNSLDNDQKKLLVKVATDKTNPMTTGNSKAPCVLSNLILIAAKKGDAEAIKALHAVGADVNARDAKKSRTPVFIAAEHGRAEAITALHAANADINAGEKTGGYTPVFIAAQNGHAEAIKALHAAGITNVNTMIDGVTPIAIAASNGHAAAITALKNAGAHVHLLTSGSTPMGIAAKQGHAEVITALHAAGADVNTGEKTQGYTPIHFAAMDGHVEAIIALHAAHANVNKLNNEGTPPIYYAAMNKHTEAVQALLVARANVDTPNSKGCTSIFAAAENGDVTMIKALLVARPNVNTPGKSGCTPVYIAAQNGHAEVIKILHAAGANIHTPDNQGSSPLSIAAYQGHAATITALHAAGADVNTLLKKGYTLVCIAAEHNHAEVITALKAAGANVDISENEKRTPVFIAAEHNHAEAITALKAANANVNTPNEDGCTPIYAATQRGHVAAIKALLAARAHVDTPNSEGHTPVFVAAKDGRATIITALLAARAHVDTPDKEKRTPVFVAAQNGHATTITALYAAGAGANVNIPNDEGRTPICAAACNGHIKAIKALLAAHAHIDTRDKNGWTPVCAAACNGQAAAIRTLKDAGANVFIPENNMGCTPVFAAACNGHAEAITALHLAGADVNTLNKQGYAPIHTAAQKGHRTAVVALLEARANANTRQTKHGTALEQASRAGHQEIVRLLKQHIDQYPQEVTLHMNPDDEEQKKPILTQFHHSVASATKGEEPVSIDVSEAARWVLSRLNL